MQSICSNPQIRRENRKCYKTHRLVTDGRDSLVLSRCFAVSGEPVCPVQPAGFDYQRGRRCPVNTENAITEKDITENAICYAYELIVCVDVISQWYSFRTSIGRVAAYKADEISVKSR